MRPHTWNALSAAVLSFETLAAVFEKARMYCLGGLTFDEPLCNMRADSNAMCGQTAPFKSTASDLTDGPYDEPSALGGFENNGRWKQNPNLTKGWEQAGLKRQGGRTDIGHEAEQADLEVEDREENDSVELLRHLVQQWRALPGSCLGSGRGSCHLAARTAHPPHRQLSQLLVPVKRRIYCVRVIAHL